MVPERSATKAPFWTVREAPWQLTSLVCFIISSFQHGGIYIQSTGDLHKEDTTNSAVDLDGRDTVDERRDKFAASTGNTSDVEVSGTAAPVSIRPDSTDVEVLGGGLASKDAREREHTIE